MNLLQKLFGRTDAPPEATTAPAPIPRGEDPFERLEWLEADANPFGVRALDCQPMANAMPAMQEPAAAARFVELRGLDGARLRDQHPEEPTHIACALQWPFPRPATDGVLFRAEVMEDRWDVFLIEGWFYFVRSWSGQLVYRASVRFEPGRAIARVIEAPSEAVREDAAFCVREVDYLLKSHVLDAMVPHPLPAAMPNNPKQIALFSFSRHGRRGCFATFGDATAFDPVYWAAGQERARAQAHPNR
ncbi:MAG: hypothetical protein ABIU54_04290 [Candidatus Eisenbacteria bacterium]